MIVSTDSFVTRLQSAPQQGFQDTDICRDGRKNCSEPDCQRTHPKHSISAHFTFCKKLWDCSDGNVGTVVWRTCVGLLREWYAIRRELENWWLSSIDESSSFAKHWGKPDNQQSYYWKRGTKYLVKRSRVGGLDDEHYFGYCNKHGTDGYIRLAEPDGPEF